MKVTLDILTWTGSATIKAFEKEKRGKGRAYIHIRISSIYH